MGWRGGGMFLITRYGVYGWLMSRWLFVICTIITIPICILYVLSYNKAGFSYPYRIIRKMLILYIEGTSPSPTSLTIANLAS